MLRVMIFSVAMVVISACATTPVSMAESDQVAVRDIQTGSRERSQRNGRCGDPISPSDGLVLDLASEHYQAGRARSALAHLESVEVNVPDFRLLQADALSVTGQVREADKVYEGLINSCLSASAYHGLALNAVKRLALDDVDRYMVLARQLDPVNPDIRNDNGYRLMLKGQYAQAEQEFFTALEINQNQVESAQNLILLYLLTNREAEAEQIARRYQVSPDIVQALKQHDLSRTDFNGV